MYQAFLFLVAILLVRLCRANSEIDVCPYRCDPFYTAISRLTGECMQGQRLRMRMSQVYGDGYDG